MPLSYVVTGGRCRLDLETPPSAEPVTLSEAKLYSRITGSREDDLITAFIKSARQKAEDYCNSSFITQTWILSMDNSPSSSQLELPRGPLQSISSVKYYDSDYAEQTLSSDEYYAIINGFRNNGRLQLKSGYSWPTSLREADNFKVEYVVGYGDAASDVPEAIKTGIKAIISDLYENREKVQDRIPPLARASLQPYKIYRL